MVFIFEKHVIINTINKAETWSLCPYVFIEWWKAVDCGLHWL